MDDIADLLAQYQQALSDPAFGAHELWQVFVRHDWYQGQLHAYARQAVRKSGAVTFVPEDVEHEVLLLLLRKLKSAPDLHFSSSLGERAFAAWMRTVIYNDCLEAMRRLRRIHATEQMLPDVRILMEEDPEVLEDRIDLSLAIDRLPDDERYLVVLYSKGLTVVDIAAEIGLSYTKVRYRLRRGLRRLKHLLGPSFARGG